MVENSKRKTLLDNYANGTRNFRGIYLRGADLSKTDLRSVDFRGADLQEANLSKTNLEGAIISNAKLQGANLEGVKVRGANLNGANLSGANLEGVNLNGTNLNGANLSGANLKGANLNGTNLNGANLSGANLKGANLHEANLEAANLSGANLRGANLNGANLEAAKLSGANLRGANLNGAKGANLEGANISNRNKNPSSLSRKSPNVDESTRCNKLKKASPATVKDKDLAAKSQLRNEALPVIKQIVEGGVSKENESKNKILQKNNYNYTSEIENITTAQNQLNTEKYFTPQSIEDAKERTLTSIVRRRGQAEFRKSLLKAYNYRCAITGCDAEQALEAAHIKPYNGTQTNDPSNGLILRADLHTLFDLKLIAIDPETSRAYLEPSLRNTYYAELHEKLLQLPKNINKNALQWRCQQCGWYR